MSTAIEGMDEIIKEFLVESGEGVDLLDRTWWCWNVIPLRASY
jgi:hypothetical protein